MTTPTPSQTTDQLMDEATEITKEIKNVIDDGLFPFQQVRLLVWEGLRKWKPIETHRALDAARNDALEQAPSLVAGNGGFGDDYVKAIRALKTDNK